MWEGAASGHPKDQAQTPYEYVISLQKAIGSQFEPLESITEAYVRDRYGHVQASEEEGIALVRKWLSLRDTMRSSQS